MGYSSQFVYVFEARFRYFVNVLNRGSVIHARFHFYKQNFLKKMTYTRELEIILTLLDFFISLGVEVYVDNKCCDFSASPIANQVRERRRSRSRSRHRIESELAKRFQEIPAVNDTYEYLVSAYTLIKDSNPLVKESLQRSEDLAFWMRDKTEQVLSATRLDQPLKAIDANAARTLEEMESIRTKVKKFPDLSTVWNL